MLKLKDLFVLPEVERLVEQIVASESGLVVVAGLDPRLLTPPLDRVGFLPSGRSAILRILMRQMLDLRPGTQAIVVTEAPDSLRVSPSLRRRVKVSLVQEPADYAEAVARAAKRRPDLLVVERLGVESAAATLEAAHSGLRVLSQLDTVLRGAEVARHLFDLEVAREHLGGLSWVLAVQRLATLCPHCREPAPSEPAVRAELRHRYPHLGHDLESEVFYRARGCAHCHKTGRAGEVTALDIFRNTSDAQQQTSVLSFETYLLGLAARGHLALDDLLHFETDRLRRTDSLLAASDRSLAQVRTQVELKATELEAANRVLQHRTAALVALEGIGQALSASASLDELAAHLCRSARDLCDADRSILYVLLPEQGLAEVLAACGWDLPPGHQPLEAAVILDGLDAEPSPFNQRPPGIPQDPSDVTSAALRAGLRVPLIAQDEPVGLMIVHTSRKPHFTPGEVALLQTFANQAAVAIQRARLIQALQDKITQLEAAQAELVQKERMERELELARQVQQSVLPRIFPLVPGYSFAARNRPARQVGGDFYDVILLDAERFAVVIGDVSDKGMPAALYMALTRSLLLAEARRSDSPRVVLTNVHRLLQQLGRPGLFVTVFYGVIDGPARQLTYARAGHDRPLLIHEGEAAPLGGKGTFLGFPDLEELHLSEEKLGLIPGDRLVLYTDGLTDALAPDGQSFGKNRLTSRIQDLAALPPDEFCAAVFAELAIFQESAEQYDDMTMLVVKVM